MAGGIAFRRGTPDDSRACHQLLYAAITTFEAEFGTPLEGTEPGWWTGTKPFFGYLAADAAEWWVAEEQDSGELIGYARSIENDGLAELTEFFVRPGDQARGLGRELLDRTFPAGLGTVRAIIATRDVRALARYYAIGMVARFPILGLAGTPGAGEMPAGLSARRVEGDAEADVALIRSIEKSLLGFERSASGLRCLLENREVYLYQRGETSVGFSFLSTSGCGPIGALDPADLPGVLLHVEGRMRALGADRLSLEIPAPNEVATRHLLARGFRFDPFISFLMSDRPFGRFDRFIGFSPPLFL